MVKFTFAAILAASIAAPALGAAISFDRLDTRDVANTDSQLFGRAVAEVFNDMYTREELSELMERDVEEFTARDLAELMEREFDIDESMITRDLLDASEDLDARAPIFGWIKKKLGFGSSAPAPEQTARDFEDDFEAREYEDDVFEARDSMADHDLEARAPIFKWIKKKLGFGGAPTEEQAARDFDEDTLDARAEGAAPAPAPKQPNIIEKFLNLFRNKNHPGAKAAAAKKNAGGEAAAPAAPAAEAPAAEAPATRYFDDEDLMERDYEEDVFERDFEDYEDILERDYEVDELD